MRKFLLAVALFALAALPAAAQVAVQQSPTRLDACNLVANGNGAVNTQVTATATPSAGQYVYICEIDFEFCNDGTGNTAGAAVTTVAATNLPAAFKWQFPVSTATGACFNLTLPFPKPLKSSTASTAVTIQTMAALTHTAPNVNALYYSAP
jgi:hypothetical protein